MNVKGTQSTVKAQDFNIKVRIKGKEVFVKPEDIEVDGVKLGIFIQEVQNLSKGFATLNAMVEECLEVKDVEIGKIQKKLDSTVRTVNKLVRIEKYGIERVIRK